MTEIENIFNAKGIRPTSMRILIYKYMVDSKVAVALTDVEAAFTKAERTTLYRTLKTFEEKGIVHHIEDGTGIKKYALCEPDCNCEVDQDLHLHFHCTHCHKTVCLTDHKIPHMNLPEGYITENVNLVVKGICNNCNNI